MNSGLTFEHAWIWVVEHSSVLVGIMLLAIPIFFGLAIWLGGRSFQSRFRKIWRIWAILHDPNLIKKFIPKFTRKSALRRRILLSASIPVVLWNWQGVKVTDLPMIKQVFEKIEVASQWNVYFLILAYLVIRWAVDALPVLLKVLSAYAKVESNVHLDGGYYVKELPPGMDEFEMEPPADDPDGFEKWLGRSQKLNAFQTVFRFYVVWIGSFFTPLVVGIWAMYIATANAI